MMIRLGNNTIFLALCSMLLQRGRTWALEEQLEGHNKLLRGGRDLRREDPNPNPKPKPNRREDCSTVVCPALSCNEGCVAHKPDGECCEQCRCKGQLCDYSQCDVVDCLPGYYPYAEPGTCCEDDCKAGEGAVARFAAQEQAEGSRRD